MPLPPAALAALLFVAYRRRQNKKYADHAVGKFIQAKAAALPGGVPDVPKLQVPETDSALGPLGSALLAVELAASPAKGASARADLDSARGSGAGRGRDKSEATPSDHLLSFVTTALSTISESGATGGLSWQSAAAKELGEGLAGLTVPFAELRVRARLGSSR